MLPHTSAPSEANWLSTRKSTASLVALRSAHLYACVCLRILSSYYLSHHPELGQTTAGAWAAMFGLLNVFTRPGGGCMSSLNQMRFQLIRFGIVIADFLYKRVGPARGTKTKQFWCKFSLLYFRPSLPSIADGGLVAVRCLLYFSFKL